MLKAFYALIIFVSFSVHSAGPSFCEKKLSFIKSFGGENPSKIKKTALKAAEILTRLEGVNKILKQARKGVAHITDKTERNAAFFSKIVEVMKLDFSKDKSFSRLLPKKGPVTLIANHPFGGLDGITLLSEVLRVRSDVKIVINHLMKDGVEEFHEIGLPIYETNPKANLKSISKAIDHLNNSEGVVIIFPSGKMSDEGKYISNPFTKMENRVVFEDKWDTGISRIVNDTNTDILPVFFKGGNSYWFQQITGISKVFPVATIGRLLMVPFEFLNKKNKKVKISLGNLIKSKRLKKVIDKKKLTNQEIADFLQEQTYKLQNRPWKTLEPIIESIDKNIIEQDIDTLLKEKKSHILLRNYLTTEADQKEDVEIHLIEGSSITDNLIKELGRLKEITFRDEGEGSGKSLDQDKYDTAKNYYQMILWNKATKEIVGSYRLGLVDEIIADKKQGIKGLYNSGLYGFSKSYFEDSKGKTIELGRSFVVKKYQGHPKVLSLLWKGILRFVYENPDYNNLIGSVSISMDYTDLSKSLIVQTMNTFHQYKYAQKYVTPFTPFNETENPLHLAEFKKLIKRTLQTAELDYEKKNLVSLLQKAIEGISEKNKDQDYEGLIKNMQSFKDDANHFLKSGNLIKHIEKRAKDISNSFYSNKTNIDPSGEIAYTIENIVGSSERLKSKHDFIDSRNFLEMIEILKKEHSKKLNTHLTNRLNNIIEETELTNSKNTGMPDLVKFYTNTVAAKYLAFGKDEDFNTIDGLIHVRIDEIPRAILYKLMGKEESKETLEYLSNL